MVRPSKWIELDPAEPATDVAVRSLRSRIAPLQYYLVMAACKPEEDCEYVHGLRTWSRRARAVTDVFEPFLPGRRTRWLNRQLRRIRHASNEARDDDVFAHHLARDNVHPPAARLLARVRAHRAIVQQPLIALYRRLTDRRRLETRVSKILRRVCWRGEECEPGGPRVGAWARSRLQQEAAAFFAASQDLASPDALHQFRIRGKRLRYALELLGGAFDLALPTELHAAAVSLQEQLGELNDCSTAQTRLQHWSEVSDSAADVAYLQALRADAEGRERQCRATFFAWWTVDRQGELQQRFADLLGQPPSAPGD